jgi:hypothetical protein
VPKVVKRLILVFQERQLQGVPICSPNKSRSLAGPPRPIAPFSVPLRVTLLANVVVPFSVPLRVTLLANVRARTRLGENHSIRYGQVVAGWQAVGGFRRKTPDGNPRRARRDSLLVLWVIGGELRLPKARSQAHDSEGVARSDGPPAALGPRFSLPPSGF